jgi:acylphosphatase
MCAVLDKEPGAELVRLVAVVHGRVQGVGFRWWTRRRATELGLAGHARNLADGRVEVVAEGPRSACERLLDLLRAGSTPGAVDQVAARWDVVTGGCGGFIEC